MQPLRIVKTEISVYPYASITWGFVLVEIDILVLYGTPQPFDKDVVESPSPVVHADLGSGVEEDVSEFRTCEVAALIAVHDFWNGYFQGLVACIKNEVYLQRIVEFPAQNISGKPVDYRHQIEPVCPDRDICDVYRPHLIGMVDFKPLKKVRVYRIARLRFARVLAWINGLYAHFVHMVEHRLMIDLKAILTVENLADPPVTIEWASRIYLVNVQFHHQIIF